MSVKEITPVVMSSLQLNTCSEGCASNKILMELFQMK